MTLDPEGKRFPAELKAPPTSLRMRWFRRAVFALLRQVDQGAQRRITDMLKLIRATYSSGSHFSFAPADFLAPVHHLTNRDGQTPLGRFVAQDGFVCLTHDVDWIECQRYIPELIEIEEGHGIKSTFYFLTDWNYKLDRDLVLDLAGAGYEVALHGSDHDIAIAYRSYQSIRDKLLRAMTDLPVPVKGYRSPALSSSDTLYAVLQELNFVHDSSLVTRDLYGRGVGYCFPYCYPGYQVWELPLTLQDSTLFRDLHLGDAEAADIVQNLMRAVVEMGGVFVFNGHPGILQEHKEFLSIFLEHATEFRVMTMDAGLRYWENCGYWGRET